MTLTFPILALAGVLFAAVPIVLHLLSRRRRRRVAWAAMDFLLTSDRRNRNRVRIDEWLLLASRVALALLAGLLAAAPRATDTLAGWLAAGGAHTVVVLDDSASMHATSAGVSSWSRAVEAVARLKERLDEDGGQATLVRYTDALAELEPLALDGTSTSPLPAEPTLASPTINAALAATQSVLDATPAGVEKRLVWLSDFAATTHKLDQDGDASGPLAALVDSADRVALATCGVDRAGVRGDEPSDQGEDSNDNLSVAAMRLRPGPVAAGVATRLVVEVANHADQPVGETRVVLRRNGKPLGTVTTPAIPPLGRTTVETPLWLPDAGVHALEARMPGDRFTPDDTRWLAVTAEPSRRVWIVDESPRETLGRVLAAALAPTRARTGWSTRVAPTPPPRDAETTTSDSPVCVLADAGRLGRDEVGALLERVARGGGLLMVLGPRTTPTRFNELWPTLAGDGSLLSRLRLDVPASAPLVAPGRSPLDVIDHPATQALTGDRAAFLPLVRIAMRHRPTEGFRRGVTPASLDDASAAPAVDERDGAWRTLAQLSDGSPLLLAGRHAKGRVAVLLTSLAPATPDEAAWSNLATLPVTPVLLNELVAWLAVDALRPAERLVGGDIGEVFDAASNEMASLERFEAASGFRPVDGLFPSRPLVAATPGVYRVASRRPVDEPTAFSAAIAPEESDLRAASLDSVSGLPGVTVTAAERLFRDEPPPAGRLPAELIGVAVLVVLGLERWLALRCSYLPAVESPSLGVAGR